MEPIKLNKAYRKAVSDYVKEFEGIHNVETETSDNWNYFFSDISLSFDELKFSVDKNLSFDDILSYFDYCLNYCNLSPINLKNYMKFRTEIKHKKGFGFKESDLIVELLTNRIKSLLKD